MMTFVEPFIYVLERKAQFDYNTCLKNNSKTIYVLQNIFNKIIVNVVMQEDGQPSR